MNQAHYLITYCEELERSCKLLYPNNKPCSIWVRQSRNNWLWLQGLTAELNKEFKRRFGKRGGLGKNHKSAVLARALECPNLPNVPMTPFALAMPDECKILNECGEVEVVESYRNYYLTSKTHLLKWYRDEYVPWLEQEPQRG